MDGTNWRPTQGADPAAPAGGDWRAQLQPEARTSIVNKIMETLKNHLPVSVPDGLNELQKIAVRFEEKIYTAATNQSDYLRKISLKMLSMETKSQQPNSQHASMDGPNWRPTQGADPAAGVDPNAPVPAPAGGDWHAQLQPEARTRIVNKIMETMKKHLPVSVPEGLDELQKIAVRLEENIYTSATNQSDYLRKISLKMLSMETKPQQPRGNAQVIANQNPSGPGSSGPCSQPDHRRALKGKSNQMKKKGRARQVKEKK